MFGIIFVAVCLFVALVSFYYYYTARAEVEKRSEAELALERMLGRKAEKAKTKGAEKETEEEVLGPIGRLLRRPARALQERIPLLQYGTRNDFLDWLDLQLMYAGMKQGKSARSAEEVVSIILTFWMIMVAILVFMVFGLNFPALIAITLLLVVIAFPYVFINSRKKARQEQVFFELPIFMEDMITNLGTGTSTIDDALSSVVDANLNLPQRRKRILPEEFGKAFAEYRYAGRSRDEALREVGHRLGVDPVSDFIDLLIQGLNTGFPIRDILMKQSAQVQEIWKQEMRAYIGRKESSFVVSVGLIAIGVLVLVLTPMILNILGALSGG